MVKIDSKKLLIAFCGATLGVILGSCLGTIWQRDDGKMIGGPVVVHQDEIDETALNERAFLTWD